MKPVELTVKALQRRRHARGRTRTLYETEYGPMFTSILGLPLFPWTPVQGYALGDVNYENFRYLNHFLDTDRAQVGRASTTGSSSESRASPGSTSIAADRKGTAYYSMDGAIPNVPDEKADPAAPARSASRSSR